MFRLSPRVVPAAALLLIVGLLAAALLRNGRGGVAEVDSDPLDRSVDLALRDIRFTETRNGVRKYRLSAETAAYSAVAENTRVDGIDMVFFSRDGRDIIKVRAPQGELATASGEVTLRGAVEVTGEQGYTLTTDHLVYRKNDDQIITDAAVVLRSPQMVLTGRGMLLRVHDQKLVLQDKVQAHFTPLVSGVRP